MSDLCTSALDPDEKEAGSQTNDQGPSSLSPSTTTAQEEGRTSDASATTTNVAAESATARDTIEKGYGDAPGASAENASVSSAILMRSDDDNRATTPGTPLVAAVVPASDDIGAAPRPAPTDRRDEEAASAASTAAALADPLQQQQADKVKIHLVAVGNAPILKRNKFQIGADQKFAAVTAFVSKTIKRPSVFLYCSSCFCPSPDESLGDLRDCFALPDSSNKDARGELIIHYSLQEAWG